MAPKKLEHILCVDDEEMILAIETMCLEDVGGYRVSTAEHGLDALGKLPDLQPDLVLLDVMMPEMDGPSLLQAMQTQEALRHIPVIFVTARVRKEDVDSYMKLGALGVIYKPFDPMEFSKQVADLWEKQDFGEE